jgi:hypothetical protein
MLSMKTGNITNIRIEKAAKGQKGKAPLSIAIARTIHVNGVMSTMSLYFSERANGRRVLNE